VQNDTFAACADSFAAVMNKKIIIIENDQDTLDMMDFILTEEGYEVIASAGSAVLADPAAQNPALVILDQWLDGESGETICLRIKTNAVTAHTPIMLMSATTGLENTAARCKADVFLEKPFDIEHLLAVVSGLVQVSS
jgi:DNA-binding response OmpR family regulator